jgi:hypothetical protein
MPLSRVRRTNTSPTGSINANHTSSPRCPGGSGIFTPAEVVAIVTVTTVEPAIGGPLGVTVHVAFVGAPAHDIVADPGNPAAPVSSSAYVALPPAAIVCPAGPFAASAKSTPIPLIATVCGEPAAESTTVRLPDRIPVVVGANSTCTVQAEPTASVAPHVVLPATIAKSAEAVTL